MKLKTCHALSLNSTSHRFKSRRRRLHAQHKDQHNIYRHQRALTWAHFQSTYELVHVLKERTIVRVVVLYLECVESLSEQHTATQCHNVDTQLVLVQHLRLLLQH